MDQVDEGQSPIAKIVDTLRADVTAYRSVRSPLWGSAVQEAFHEASIVCKSGNSQALLLLRTALSEGLDALIDATNKAQPSKKNEYRAHIERVFSHLVRYAPELTGGIKPEQVASVMNVLTSRPFSITREDADNKRIARYYTDVSTTDYLIAIAASVAENPQLAMAFMKSYNILHSDNQRAINLRLGFLAQHGHLPAGQNTLEKIIAMGLMPMDAMRPVESHGKQTYQPVTAVLT